MSAPVGRYMLASSGVDGAGSAADRGSSSGFLERRGGKVEIQDKTEDCGF